jgi:hypothetical protein
MSDITDENVVYEDAVPVTARTARRIWNRDPRISARGELGTIRVINKIVDKIWRLKLRLRTSTGAERKRALRKYHKLQTEYVRRYSALSRRKTYSHLKPQQGF